MHSKSSKTFTYSIPGDLHLIPHLNRKTPLEYRDFFDESKSLAEQILEADEFYVKQGRRAVKQEALERMKRIALVIRNAALTGIEAMDNKNKIEAEVSANKILHLIAEMFSEPDRSRGESMLKNVSKGGKTKAVLSKDKRAEWQHLADEYWQKRPKAPISLVARYISKETGDKFNTIRLVIKKNK